MKLTVPFYLHKAGAGFPSPATDYIEEDVDLNIHLIKNESKCEHLKQFCRGVDNHHQDKKIVISKIDQ